MKKRIIGIVILSVLVVAPIAFHVWKKGLLETVIIILVMSALAKIIAYGVVCITSDEINNKKP